MALIIASLLAVKTECNHLATDRTIEYHQDLDNLSNLRQGQLDAVQDQGSTKMFNLDCTTLRLA